MLRLKVKRSDKGFSQSGLARKAEISVRTLQHYEQKQRDINKAEIKTLIKLSNALDCKVVDILDDEELIEMIEHTDFK